jgi:hypothetical protein
MKLDDLVLDPSLQTRVTICKDTVEEYCEGLRNGAKMPPVTVFFDGKNYYLADGWHRYFAHRNAGFADIEVEIVNGTKREAQRFALSANSKHGLRRSNEDKRKSVLTAFQDEEWSQWSDREVAKNCVVSHNFVSKLRKLFGEPREEVKATRNGKELTMKVNNEASRQEQDANEFRLAEMADTLVQLQADKEALQDRIAIAAIDANEEEKVLYEETLVSLRNQVKSLEAENRALKSSLNIEREEKNHLIKQVKALKFKLDKLEKGSK